MVLIYGCYGYTGRLIVEWGKAQALPMVLSGRNADKVQQMAREFDLPAAPASLDDPDSLAKAFEGIQVVIHCAGPFIKTYRPMLAACLAHGVHYLDITGEIQVFEGVARKNAAAAEKNIMLMPGVGFDVIPTDSMAAYLHRQLPDAQYLELAFRTIRGQMSHGTASTMVMSLGEGNLLRRNGQITQVPNGQHLVEADFGRGPSTCVGIPWGDVSTAYYTTGIPNVNTYISVPPKAIRFLKLSNRFSGLLKRPWVRRIAQRRVDKAPIGPGPESRAKSGSLIWGRVRNLKGETRSAHFKTLNGYTLTALGSVHIAQAVLDGHWQAGFRTPAGLYGPELIQALDPTVTFVDIPG